MNTVEQQLVRDIAAVTGGVVVTDADLKVAREAVAERVETRRQRDRRIVLTAAAAALILIAGFAFMLLRDGDMRSAPPAEPQPTQTTNEQLVNSFLVGSPPTAEQLEGFWRLDNEGTMVRFAAPDAVWFDTAGQILHDPGVHGTYELTGDLITVTVAGGPAGCGGQQFAMRSSVPELGVLRLAHVQPGQGNCATVQDEQWVLEQVLPTGPIMAGLVLSNERGFEPLVDSDVLPGFWMAEGGGYGLQIDPNGGYSVLDESAEVVDVGQWSMRASTLTLTSSADSARCGQGDQLVLGSVEHVNPGTDVIRSSVRENPCEAEWASAVWLLIPDEDIR
jgi:hypothetical protein